MKATYLLIRFLKLFSLVAFVAMLLLAYYYLPNPVAVHFNPAGQADEYIDKSVLFYVGGVFVVLFNVLLSLAARFIFVVPAQLFPMPKRNYWLADKESRFEFLGLLRNWLNSFVFIGNTLLFVCLFILMKLNRAAGAHPADYSWIFFAGMAALGIWLFFLPVRLLFKKSEALN
jgi:uncharacterized membrane protein